METRALAAVELMKVILANDDSFDWAHLPSGPKRKVVLFALYKHCWQIVLESSLSGSDGSPILPHCEALDRVLSGNFEQVDPPR